MIAQKLLWISRNVRDLLTAVQFYQNALDFMPLSDPVMMDDTISQQLGAGPAKIVRMVRGQQTIELVCFDKRGAPYPSEKNSNDLWFVHCALSTQNIDESYKRLLPFKIEPISRNGPEKLPGGIIAFKFRDPTGNPLELIEFPNPKPVTQGGIDHVAIIVKDAAESTRFYSDRMGLILSEQQQNHGPEQDRLDGLSNTLVDVIALSPLTPAPHLELLGYRSPVNRDWMPMSQGDDMQNRLVFQVDDLSQFPNAVKSSDGRFLAMIEDPNGHTIVLST